MNQGVVVVLLALVAGSCGKSSGGHGRPKPAVRSTSFLHETLCNLVLYPTAAESEQLRSVTATCIAEQPGLEAIIAGLDTRSGESRGEEPEERENEFIGMWWHDHIRTAASVLEANGYLANATALRECTSEGMGMVNSDGTYNLDALKANILNKVGIMLIRNNTQLGLDNCPSVVEFDVVEYLNCVRTYCRTGAAP